MTCFILTAFRNPFQQVFNTGRSKLHLSLITLVCDMSGCYNKRKEGGVPVTGGGPSVNVLLRSLL